jgi:hypothetical protein
MGSNPILAATDQRKRFAPSGVGMLLAQLFLPCFYRQHAGPHRTRSDDAGPVAGSPLASHDLIQVRVGLG